MRWEGREGLIHEVGGERGVNSYEVGEKRRGFMGGSGRGDESSPMLHIMYSQLVQEWNFG